MSIACTGIGVSGRRRIAVGRAHLLLRGQVEVIPMEVPKAELDNETDRFRRALATAQQQLRQIRDQIPANTPSGIAAFIDTHLLMLEDTAIADATVELIRELGVCAEWALQVRRDELARVFDEMEDPYLRTRKDDIDHVVKQIQKVLLDQHHDSAGDETLSLEGQVILAQDLTPADTILMRHQGIAGFVTEFGSPMSHTAILARSLGIPAVVGVRHATQYLRHGETLVVDGEHGVVLADVGPAALAHFERRIRQQEAITAELSKLVDRPSESVDRQKVALLANIELAEDIAATRDSGAEGVGLYRTEFLYMNRQQVPDEEEHLRAYREVAQGLPGVPITIRTLDLGADKQLDGGCPDSNPPACNPALGLRAIRLCLKEPKLFRPQLRAILRLSATAPLRIMLPMLSHVREVGEVLTLIEETKAELRAEGIPFHEQIPVGGMIEVPAAALAAAAFARQLDFLSIGTNDLIQYTLAIDRIDDEVNYLFDPLHPAVLRLIQMTIEAADDQGVPVSMCGEMAGDPRFTRLLLGMGLREFSMQPGSLLEVKRIIRASDLRKLQRQVTALMRKIDSEDVGLLVDQLNHEAA